MFNFNFDKVYSTYHSIYLRRFRPKTVFLSTIQSQPWWKISSSAVCTIKVFINLTLYLSSDFYEIIEFLKISSDYILFICVVLYQNRIFEYLFKPRWNSLSTAEGVYQTLQCIYLRIFIQKSNFSKIFRIT